MKSLVCPKCGSKNIDVVVKDKKYKCRDCGSKINNNDIIKFVKVNEKAKNGINKCPWCGSSDILFDEKRKKLVCQYCKKEIEEKIDRDSLKEKSGIVRGVGTKDIKKNAKDIITLKCDGCGAKVVINTKEKPYERCHWCRSLLTINDETENGVIPDMILPFSVTKEEAKKSMKSFLKKRRRYARHKFKRDLNLDNIVGVYLPYYLIDIKAKAHYTGTGKHITNKSYNYFNDSYTYYYDVYDIVRKFDIDVEGFTIESNSDKLDLQSKNKSNNIINSIMPFDTENCVKYTSNYLIGYNLEVRDVNVKKMDKTINEKINNIAENSIEKKMDFFDGGFEWTSQNINYKNKEYMSSYLPVWLYTYVEKKENMNFYTILQLMEERVKLWEVFLLIS